MAKRHPIDPRSPKAIWDEQYRLGAELPFTWALIAAELRRTFNLVWRQQLRDHKLDRGFPPKARQIPPLSRVANLLAGLVLENLCKAVLVSRHSPLDAKGKLAIATHDLPDLMERVGVSLDTEERRVVEKLQESVIWAGCYPVPLSIDSMRPRTLANGGFAPITFSYFPHDTFIFERVQNKLWSLVPSKFRFRFQSLNSGVTGKRAKATRAV